MSSVVSHRKIQMDLWPFFFLNTTQKSLATVDIAAYMGWCIWSIQQFNSLKKNNIAFCKSISGVFVDDLVHVRNGPRWQWHMSKLCRDLWKNWYSMSAVKILRTTVKSFCMKSLIQVFFSRCITEFTLQLRYDETNQIDRAISQIPQCTNSISHNTPFRIECAHFCSALCIVGYRTGTLLDLCIGSIWYEDSNHFKKGKTKIVIFGGWPNFISRSIDKIMCTWWLGSIK